MLVKTANIARKAEFMTLQQKPVFFSKKLLTNELE